jgi:DNA-binding transcriptional LysR family regulator
VDVHLRDLRYFTAVAEELSFTRASERLYVSQPGLSKQIRMLENRLRVRLFDRDRRTVELTAAGAALLPVARELLSTWDEAQRTVSDAAAEEESVLTIGLSTSVGRGLLPRARELFAERRPGWTFRLKQVNWQDATAGLADGEVDAALVWLPVPGQDAYRIQVLATETRWVAFREDHWLAGRDKVALGELLAEPFLALPESAGPLRDYWLAVPERGGEPVKVGAVVANADETFAAIEEGSGIVLLSSGNATIYQRPGVRAVPVVDLSPSQLAVAWRAGDHRAAIRDFVEAVSRSHQP